MRQFVCDVADIDECQTNNGGCSAVASCSNTEGGFTCTCPSGYAGDGTTCSGVQIHLLMMMMMMIIIIIIIILSIALQRFNAILLHESFVSDADPDL